MPSDGVKEVIMKTFYSILYAVIRPETDEKIAVGLILSDGSNSLFDSSKNKLGAVKSLLGSDAFKYIRNYISSVKKTIQDSMKNSLQHSIFEFIDSRHPVINEKYFHYLTVYSTNLVWFSKPLQIDVPAEKETFRKLFNKLVDEEYGEVTDMLKVRGVRRAKIEFIPTVKEYFSHEREVTSSDVSGLITPVSIDLIGRNDRMVFAQFLEMERAIREIKYDFFDIKELKAVEQNSMGFLVSSEPDIAKFGKQHQIWENIRKYDQFNYLDIDEVDKIKEYAEAHQIVPYFAGLSV